MIHVLVLRVGVIEVQVVEKKVSWGGRGGGAMEELKRGIGGGDGRVEKGYRGGDGRVEKGYLGGRGTMKEIVNKIYNRTRK